MTTFSNRYLKWAAAFALAVVIAACESSDKIPPKGSTVTVGANPAMVRGNATLSNTVRSKSSR